LIFIIFNVKINIKRIIGIMEMGVLPSKKQHQQHQQHQQHHQQPDQDEFEAYLAYQIELNLNRKKADKIIMICNYSKSYLKSKQIIDQITDILTYHGEGDLDSIYEFLKYLYVNYKLYEQTYVFFKNTKPKNNRAIKITKYICKALKKTESNIRKCLKL